MDSPGHIDFSTEVTTAVRLCDGAVVVVDAMEGVRSQTRTVLLQAWRERLRLIVFVNKVDKLFDIYQPADAAAHLERVLEDLNLCLQQHYTADLMSRIHGETEGAALNFDENLEKEFSMDPVDGKVLFGSALHGWAFEVGSFATIAAKKLSPILAPAGQELSAEKVKKLMWGPRYLDVKAKKVVAKPPTSAAAGESQAKNLFALLVLDPLFKIHSAADSGDVSELKRLAELTLTTQEQKDIFNLEIRVASSHGTLKDPQAQTRLISQALLKAWMPLTTCLMRAITLHLPSPSSSAPIRLPHLCPDLSIAQLQATFNGSLWACDPLGPTTVYIARFLSADLKSLTLLGDRLVGSEKSGDFVGIVRVFCGTLRPGQRLKVIRDERSRKKDFEEYRIVDNVFRMLGRELRLANGCSAGDIVAVSLKVDNQPLSSTPSKNQQSATNNDIMNNDDDGLDEDENSFDIIEEAVRNAEEHQSDSAGHLTTAGAVERCLTLCEAPKNSCPAFVNPYFRTQGASLLKVTIDPISVDDLPKLLAGLALLQVADPAVSLSRHEAGEIVLGCCGEVHLERCISDLKQIYALVQFKTSEPITALRETLAMESVAKELAIIAANGGVVSYDANCMNTHGDVSAEEVGLFCDDVMLRDLISSGGVSTAKKLAFPPWDGIDEPSGHHSASSIQMNNEKDHLSDAASSDRRTGVGKFTLCHGRLEVELYAIRLNNEVVSFLDAHQSCLSNLKSSKGVKLGSLSHFGSIQGCASHIESLLGLKGLSLWSFSVANDSRTLLLSANSDKVRIPITTTNGELEWCFDWSLKDTLDSSTTLNSQLVGGWLSAVFKAFELASKSGPLCSEAMRGVGFVISKINCCGSNVEHQLLDTLPYVVYGQALSSARNAFREAFLRPGLTRLMEASLKLEVECEQDMLGRTYSELSKRRARILDEQLKDGSTSFIISALIPMSESLGLSHGLRNSASGQILMHAEFSGWEVMNADLFPEACMNADQLEEWGEKGRPHNMARKVLLNVRKRKGLPTGEKIVMAAEKQRNLSRKV